MEELKGTFRSDLLRNFKDLKEAKVEGVVEDVETAYRRNIEDLCKNIRRMDRQREDIMLSLAPSSRISTKVIPDEFDADQYLAKDMEIGLSKRNLIIKLEIAVERYVTLFGALDPTTQNLVSKILPQYVNSIKEA